MIICDEKIFGSTYAEAYSGRYFFRCDTYDEVRRCLGPICVSRGKKLSELSPEDITAEDRYFVLVEFSKEEDYTEHELYWMTVQKKYVKRFLKFLRESGIAVPEGVAA